MRKALLILATSVASAVALPAAGQSTTTAPNAGTNELHMPYQTGFWNYIGGTVGRSDYDIGCAPDACDNNATGLKVFAGGKLYNILGLELAYVNLGRVDVGPGDARAQGANASLVLGVPLWADKLGVNAKIGTIYGWTKTNAALPGYDSGEERGWGLSYGVGATYAVTRNVELRLDWDRYRFDFRGAGSNDADLVSAGLNFRF